MRNMLRADLFRMYRGRWLVLCTLFMMAVAASFVVLQRTAMDYTVLLDRVIFLPMSVYGVAAAALVSAFIGEDMQNGGVRNKIIAGASRSAIYFSGLMTSCLGCMTVYVVTFCITLGLGLPLFSNNVTAGRIVGYFALGLCMCLAYGSVFCTISMLLRNRNAAVIVCMGLSFAMLLMCLHTNQVLSQAAFVDGVRNPAYAEGAKRVVYLLLHDVNPTGQAAQLSAMQCLNAVRFVAVDFAWVGIAAACLPAFLRQDIR